VWFYKPLQPCLEPDWSKMDFFIGCDPAATSREALVQGKKAETDWWTIVVGAREKSPCGEPTSEIYLKELWRGRCTKQEYLDALRGFNERYKPLRVVIETVAAQEYLAQDAERWMPVTRLKRTTDKVARAYWLQPFFENAQIVLPAKHVVSDYTLWQALMDELVLFPQGEHDDLFDGLQTMVEGATAGPTVRAYKYSPFPRW
jgi:predicted phage terminase large subunit-like protein